MNARVTDFLKPGIVDTVVRFEGVDIDTEQQVVFAADHRPAEALIHALRADDGEDIIADVPDWAVLWIEPLHDSLVRRYNAALEAKDDALAAQLGRQLLDEMHRRHIEEANRTHPMPS